MSTNRARYTDTELLDAVREIALLEAPNAPESLSQPRYDAGRTRIADTYPDLPTARAIYMRLNSGTQGTVPWSSLVKAAVTGEASERQAIAAARRANPDVPVDERLAFFALNLAAKELASRSPSPDQYDALVTRLRHRRRHALAKLLPTANQLATFAGGWNEALILAGLVSRAPAGGHRADPSRWEDGQRPVSTTEGIHLFLATQGRLPSRDELRAFASKGNFRLSETPRRPWQAHSADARQAWIELGRWWPARSLPRGSRPALYEPLPDDLPDDLALQRRNRWADIAVCARVLNDYWDTLPPGTEPKQKRYGVWAVDRDAPAPSRFQQHGGFSAVREHARALRRARVSEAEL